MRFAAWTWSLAFHVVAVFVLLILTTRPKPELQASPVEVSIAGIEPAVEMVATPEEDPQEPAEVEFEDELSFMEDFTPAEPIEDLVVRKPAEVHVPDPVPLVPAPKVERTWADTAPQPAPVPRSSSPVTPARPAAPPATSTAAARGGGVLRLVSKPSVRGFYPDSARRRGLEGTTVVIVRVDTSGRVVHAITAKSSGHLILDTAAVRVARQHRFEPGVKGRALLPIRFRLTD